MLDLNQFRKIKIYKRNTCVICGKNLKHPLIRMPQFPLTEIYVKKKINEKLGFADQEFHLCQNCGHGQIKNIIDPSILYGSSYITRTSTSSSATQAVNIFLQFVNNNLKNRKVKTVLEIGCNDLYTLRQFNKRADRLVGIDPILKGKESTFKDDKIRIVGDFFENVDINKLKLEMDVVISSHTIEHIENPRKLFKKMLDAGTNETLFFFQFPGLETLINDAHFDQIFHQHLNYFSLQSVLFLLDEVGGELLDFRLNPYHWGALLIAFKKRANGISRQHHKFDHRIQRFSEDYVNKQHKLFIDCLKTTKERIGTYKERKIYGYGAAQMLPVLDYYLNLKSTLKGIIDDEISKTNLYYLNLPLKIMHPSMIKNIKNSVILVTAINSLQTVRSVVNRLIELNIEKIILPVNLI